MKLRLAPNSIRLRLNRDDVARLLSTGVVEERLIVAGATFTYALRATSAQALTATFTPHGLTLEVPQRDAARWAASDEVSFDTARTAPPQQALHLLIEKDFECLDARAGDPAEPLYPNPKSRAR